MQHLNISLPYAENSTSEIMLMQEKNHARTKEILLSVAKHLKVKGIRGLANALNEKESKIYAWINRCSIGDVGAILDKCPEIRADWLKTGEGPMLKNKFQQVAGQAPALAVKELEENYPHLAAEIAKPMAVTREVRAVGDEHWQLLDCFDALCEVQKAALLTVAETMAAGVPHKSPPKERPGENLPERKSGLK